MLWGVRRAEAQTRDRQNGVHPDDIRVLFDRIHHPHHDRDLAPGSRNETVFAVDVMKESCFVEKAEKT